MNENQICAHCVHYRLSVKGGPAGQCWCMPPTAILLGRGPDGGLAIGAARVPVPGNTPACGQFKQKLIIEPDGFSKLPPMPPGGKG